MKPNRRVAEYIFPGHPDKLCDAIADALVAEAARRDRRALCGVEVAIHRNTVTVTGRMAGSGVAAIDVNDIVRGIYLSAGYRVPSSAECPCECPGRRGRDCVEHPSWEPAPGSLRTWLDLCLGDLLEGEAEFRALADDQSVVTGYAIDLPATNYLPLEHWLVSGLARRLASLRTQRPDLLLGPDGKVLLTLEHLDGRWQVEAVTTSMQQKIFGDAVALHRAVREVLAAHLADCALAIPELIPEAPNLTVVNGAGNFAVGGPEGDNGLSGKKLVCDAYGPAVPIGGGALSGKDFFKVDRAGAILARRLAKAAVVTGAARECTATLAFFPGDDRARILSLVDGDGGTIDGSRWERLVDLSLEGVGERFTGTADLVDVARYGHFLDPSRPWEDLGRW